VDHFNFTPSCPQSMVMSKKLVFSWIVSQIVFEYQTSIKETNKYKFYFLFACYEYKRHHHHHLGYE
jgi:hypothetical protein